MTQENITIEVAFFGYLKQYTEQREPHPLALPAGSTVRAAAQHYKVPERLIKLVNINGVKATLDTVLQPGDKLHLQPVLIGG